MDAHPPDHPPPAEDPGPDPAPGCRICRAGEKAREAARATGNAAGARRYAAIIAAHPHRHATPDADLPADGEPPIRSALTFPPCPCGSPRCPDAPVPGEAEPSPASDDRSYSPTMRRLRPHITAANERTGWGRR